MRTDAGQREGGRAPRERALLVGVHLPQRHGERIGGEADLDELALLADTAGAVVVGRLEQQRERPDSRAFVGSGKLQELKERAAELTADLIVFDNDLSPAQGRNLERETGVKVLDRTELILDIFARNARTRQARLQVELAQLQYMLPRLARLWKHLERQAGGIGTRGPGETQLETDRRLVRRRIAQLQGELAEVATGREVQRKRREGTYQAVLVGYTNAGKSTLLNGLAGADVLVQDRLFATLDATTRRVELDERHRFLLTDTVGFIRRLPHHLVESFRATLQEVREADLLVHVVDAASEDPQRQIDAVHRVLADLVPQERPTLLVFNKLDRVEREPFVNHWSRAHPGAVFASAVEPEGLQQVREGILSRLLGTERVYRLTLPLDRLGELGPFHRTGAVLEQQCYDGVCRAVVRMREQEARRWQARAGGSGLEPVHPA